MKSFFLSLSVDLMCLFFISLYLLSLTTSFLFQRNQCLVFLKPCILKKNVFFTNVLEKLGFFFPLTVFFNTRVHITLKVTSTLKFRQETLFCVFVSQYFMSLID